MSVEQIALVLNHSRAKGTDKVVLIGIANHDGDGGAWPSIETLMRYANCAERTVQDSIARLCASGELSVEANAGGTVRTRADRRTNLYRIHVSPDNGVRPTAPGEPDGVRSDVERGAVHRTDGVRSTAPEPSLNPPENHPSVRAVAFADFWASYPRHIAKKPAESAFAKIPERDLPALLEAVPRHVAFWKASGTAEDKIPYPASWLNARRWDDELTMPADVLPAEVAEWLAERGRGWLPGPELREAWRRVRALGFTEPESAARVAVLTRISVQRNQRPEGASQFWLLNMNSVKRFGEIPEWCGTLTVLMDKAYERGSWS